MYSLLLRKALPFALTFVIGSLVGGLFRAVGFGGPSAGNARAFRYSYGGRHSCRLRFQPRNLVAESKPLQITFKPDAILSRGMKTADDPDVMSVLVTFGADGKVQKVEPQIWTDHAAMPMWQSAARAAQQIQFEPEMVDGVPVTVTREVEMRLTVN